MSALTDDEDAILRVLDSNLEQLNAARLELRRERDRRVEHRQMNQSLNEQVQLLVAQLAELTRERDEARSELDHERRAAAENYAGYRSQATRAEAAEARVRELAERVSQALTGLRPGSPVREALEEALRAP